MEEPPRDFTLEELADDAGVDADDVRDWLRREIERRRLGAVDDALHALTGDAELAPDRG